MIIDRVTYHNRNDFKAVFECELCHHTFEAWGYSDENYYYNVMPNAICPNCHKNSHGETREELISRMGREYII